MSNRDKKTPSGQHHTDPHINSGQHDKCDITGSIHVAREIETKLPPDLEKKRNAAEEKKEARDKKRFVVEWVTLVFVIVYAGSNTKLCNYRLVRSYCYAARASTPDPRAAGSLANVVLATAQPWLVPPMTDESETRALVRKTSLNKARPVISRRGRIRPRLDHLESEVGDSLVLGNVGVGTASNIPRSDFCAPDVHTF